MKQIIIFSTRLINLDGNLGLFRKDASYVSLIQKGSNLKQYLEENNLNDEKYNFIYKINETYIYAYHHLDTSLHLNGIEFIDALFSDIIAYENIKPKELDVLLLAHSQDFGITERFDRLDEDENTILKTNLNVNEIKTYLFNHDYGNPVTILLFDFNSNTDSIQTIASKFNNILQEWEKERNAYE